MPEQQVQPVQNNSEPEEVKAQDFKTDNLRDEGMLKGLQNNLFEYLGVKKELNKEIAQKEANIEGYKEQKQDLVEREQAVEQRIDNTETTRDGIENIQQELAEVKSMIMNFKQAICKPEDQEQAPEQLTEEQKNQPLLQLGGNRSRKRSLKHNKKRSKLRKKKIIN